MGHASQESLKVAQKFVKREAAKSPLTCISVDQWSGRCYDKGRRVTTDGERILSYDWWEIAHWDEDGRGCWVTKDRYQTGEWPVSGRPKYSRTTDGHIDAVRQHLGRNGYRPNGGERFVGPEYDERHYELWTKQLVS